MALASSARRLCSRIGFSSLHQTSSVSSSSPLVDAERLLSSLSLGNGNLGLFGRVFSTGVSDDLAEQAKEGLILSKPPPRPFKLNNEQRELAEEIGYKVIDRYTEEDFGRNKRPKAFAVVQIGSHQFKVSPNDLIYTEKLKYCDINDKLMLNKVLLLGSKDTTIIGRPIVPKAAVLAVVEEHALDEKVIIFKKKRRKNYRRTTGHRQELTRLRILEVKGIDVATAPPTPVRKAKAKVEETSTTAVSKTEDSVVTPVLA